MAFEIKEEWYPMPPQLGPPLPRSMQVYWPWVKHPPEEEIPTSPEVPAPPEVPPTPKYRLYIYIVGKGTVTPSDGEYLADSVVTLTAKPASGYAFDHWAGDASGTSPMVNITMDRSKSATAYFRAAPYEEVPPPEEIPPVPPAPPEVPPEVPPVAFTFSNVSAKKVIMYDAPAWETMEFYCTITNPNDVTVTKLLKVMCRWGTGSAHQEWTFELTLGPSGSYNFFWDGNRYGQRDPDAYNGPLVARRQRVCMWLEDEQGNKSMEACVTGKG